MIEHLNELLIIADMDNTLLTAKYGIPSCNIETIKLFCALGGNFTVASGRTVESISRYLDVLPITAPAIAYGGGMIYDFQNKRAIESYNIKKQDAKRATLEIMEKFPHIGVEIMAENGKIYVIRANEYTYKHTVYEKLSYVNCCLDDIKCGWLKILFAGSAIEMKKTAEFAYSLYYPSLCFIPTNDIYFEIMPQNITKGTALYSLCKLLNIKKENVIAIGDYYNDIPLFKEAGYSVAMRSSPCEVKLEANEITDDCVYGGVGQFIYKLIKENASFE
ncbi:MAG: Cof-type HAD-IIB family hydrolase [Oscillospiraceae bacterium]